MGLHDKGRGGAYLWLVANAQHTGDDCLTFPFHRNSQRGYGTFGIMDEWHRKNPLIEIRPETDSANVSVTVYGKDSAGNEPWLAINVDEGGGFISMTFEQAEAFARSVLQAIDRLRTDAIVDA